MLKQTRKKRNLINNQDKRPKHWEELELALGILNNFHLKDLIPFGERDNSWVKTRQCLQDQNITKQNKQTNKQKNIEISKWATVGSVKIWVRAC